MALPRLMSVSGIHHTRPLLATMLSLSFVLIWHPEPSFFAVNSTCARCRERKLYSHGEARRICSRVPRRLRLCYAVIVAPFLCGFPIMVVMPRSDRVNRASVLLEAAFDIATSRAGFHTFHLEFHSRTALRGLLQLWCLVRITATILFRFCPAPASN